MARGWEIQPSEFWRMTVQEWWWEYDMRVDEAKRLQDMMKDGGKWSGPKWDEARRKHREKMAKKNGTAPD